MLRGKINKTIVCVINKICHTIKYTNNSIEVLHTCKTFTGTEFSKAFKRVQKKHGIEKEFIKTADTILDAVVNDVVQQRVSKFMDSVGSEELESMINIKK